jgi:hypothetical protein
LDHTQDPLALGSAHYAEQVKAALFKLRVQAESRRQFDLDKHLKTTIPQGVLADDEPPPEPPELVPGVLLAHGANGIIGAKETGKSLTALEIQCALLTGEPLWGAIEPSRVINKTVHILAEHASPVLMGLYRRTKLPKTGKLHIFGPEHLGVMKLLVSNGIRREEAVAFYKTLVQGAGLVVFDPLASFIQGQSAENDNSPMRNLVDTMIEIATSAGAGCLILGHQGKPQIFQGRPVKRTNYATRGASSTEDAMTAVHYLDRLSGATFSGNPIFEMRPVHYKGYKRESFYLVRDRDTCRHTLRDKHLILGREGR